MDRNHYVTTIKKKRTLLEIYCRTNKKEYGLIDTIICQGRDEQECIFELVKDGVNSVEYKVALPELLKGRYSFFIITKGGEKKRVWKPAKGLTRNDLPESVYFSKYLNLTYSSDNILTGKVIKGHVYAPTLSKIRCSKKGIFIEGLLFLPVDNFQPQTVDLQVVKLRKENIYFRSIVQIRLIDGEVFSGRPSSAFIEFNQCVVYAFSCFLNLSDLRELPGSYNVFIFHAGDSAPLRNSKKGILKKKYENLCHVAPRTILGRALFVPYYDQNYDCWRMDVHHISWMERVRLWILLRWSLKVLNKKDMNIWLAGEYPTTARDNGMHFYNYLRKEHPEIEVYYIIEKEKKSLPALQDKRNVISIGSYKHFKISRKAGVLIFSHLPEYLLPKLSVISGYERHFKKFKTFFLQHGVIAMKNLDGLYGVHVRKFDKFAVSSCHEKSIVLEQLGYKKGNVCVTGLARWDMLKRISKIGNTILITPTWRKSLQVVNSQEFMRSDFYLFWNALLSDNDLLRYLEVRNIRINFTLHVALDRFADCFYQDNNVTHASIDNLQSLIASCGMFVTDYSSVAFDVLYLNKPVVYFQFDCPSDEYNSSNQYIDYANDLPGPVCCDVESTVRQIMKLVTSNYRINKMYRQRRNKFYDHIDQHNCDRLFNEIMTAILTEVN